MSLYTNLSGFWEFESGALTTDATGTQTAMTNFNTVTSVAGKVGNAASFTTASSQALYHASNSSLQPGPSMSIQAWIKCSDVTLAAQAVATKRDGSTFAWELILAQDGTLASHASFIVFDASVGAQAVTTADGSIAANTWYHIVATYDSADKKPRIYLNAAAPVVGAVLTAGILTTATAEIGIGGNHAEGIWYSSMLIDQLGLWQRALSAGEIGTGAGTLYNSGNGLSYAAMAPAGGSLFRYSNLDGLQSGGPFFNDPLGG